MKHAKQLRAALAAGGLVAALSLAAPSGAQNPPTPPSFTYLYGQALLGGENVAPEVQPVVAFVNGKSCGGGSPQTFVATEGTDVPEEDVGRTVYVIDVLADGTKNYERPGCGRPGDAILIYFPKVGRMAGVQPLFQAGPLRADLELEVALGYRGVLPQLANDGTD